MHVDISKSLSLLHWVRTSLVQEIGCPRAVLDSDISKLGDEVNFEAYDFFGEARCFFIYLIQKLIYKGGRVFSLSPRLRYRSNLFTYMVLRTSALLQRNTVKTFIQ